MWRIPSQVVAAEKGGAIPQVAVYGTDAPLAAGASFSTDIVPHLYMPIVDIEIVMDQDGSLQLECAADPAGPWRNVDPPSVINAFVTFAVRIAAYRVPNVYSRWTLTNPGAINCTITEATFIYRSL